MYAFIDNMAYFWIVVALSFLLMEMGNPGLFFFISFCFGGISAAFSTVCGFSFVGQTGIFFVSTLLWLAILQRLVVAKLSKGRPHEHTNVYALQGKRGVVVLSISEKNPGMVKVNGEKWAARSIQASCIEEGSMIEVVDMRGAHLIVKKIG